jgi:large subunit ribosomal protein L1
MDTSHLEANFSALLKDVNSVRPNREGPFITKCCLVTLPFQERLKVDYKQYINEVDNDNEKEKDEEEEDDDDDAVEDETERSEVKKTSAVG